MARGALLAAAALGALAVGARGAEELPDSVVTISGGAGGGARQFYAMRATFGNQAATLPPLTLVDATATAAPFGCDAASLPPPPVGTPAAAVAYLVERGNCTFAAKAAAVQAAGGAAVIVTDGIVGMYMAGNASGVWAPACDYHCAAGRGSVPAGSATLAAAVTGFPGQCGGAGSCDSGLCLLTQPASDAAPSAPRTLCCLVSDYLPMGGTAAATAPLTVGAFFVTTTTGMAMASYAAPPPPPPLQQRALQVQQAQHGAALRGTGGVVDAGADATVVLAARPVSTFPWASVVMWCLGVATVAVASWRSGEWERAQLAAAAAGRPRPSPDAVSAGAAAPPLAVTVAQGVGVMFCAALVLMTLFLLVRYGVDIVYFIIAIFAIGATSSMYGIVTHPAAKALLPAAVRDAPLVTLRVAGGCRQSLGATLASVAAVVPVAVWVVYRQAPWAWVLNDVLAIVLCCGVLLQLKLATVRSVTILFGLFFAYDIFMVFLTPFIFGSSVMLDVATAGVPQAPVDAPDWACFCRQHPEDTKSCGAGETMPILLRVPRIADYRGGYTMLGLGDIVVPGVLLSFALRFDLTMKLMRRSRSSGGGGGGGGVTRALAAVAGSYWAVAVVGYAVGLAAANLAVNLMRMGQPALLYLCPATLAPLLALAYVRGDLPFMWAGPPRINTAAATDAMGGAAAGTSGAAAVGDTGGGGGGGGGRRTVGGAPTIVVGGDATVSLTAAAGAGAGGSDGEGEESTPLRAAPPRVVDGAGVEMRSLP